MPTDARLPDPTRCPLCGGDNRCAMEVERETGLPQAPCWCTSQRFSAELLDRLPTEARGKACICVACLAVFDQRPTGPATPPDPAP